MITENIDIKKSTIARLRELHDQNKNLIDSAKAFNAEIESELLDRYGKSLAAELSDSGRQHGDVTGEIDGVKVTYSVKNKVEWDQDSMKAIAGSMPWNMVERIFKIEFAVAERTFKALTDQSLIDKLNDARTVKYSEPKISFAK
jgi:hypothetical protein